MANPINPATGRPWTDQEMAYFRLLEANKGDKNFASNADKYLTHVAKVNPETGNSRYIQGVDPVDQRGGLDWAQYALQADIARQAAEMARQSLGFQKGQAVGWVDGARTLEGTMRDDDIRRNPMNAAIYEQERRGFRTDAGNADPFQYQDGKVGDEAPKNNTPAKPPSGGGGGGGNTQQPRQSAAPKPQWMQAPKAAPRQQESATEAFYNPRTRQYEFVSGNDKTRWSIDENTGRDLSGANKWEGTRGTGDDRVAVGTNRTVDKASMKRAVADLNKRISSLTPEAARAFEAYDKSRGLLHGGEVEVPGYDGQFYGFNTAEDAIRFQREISPAFQEYATAQGAKLGLPEGARPQPGSKSETGLLNKFSEALRRVDTLKKDIDFVQRRIKSGKSARELRENDPETLQRVARIQQLLDIDIKNRKDKDVFKQDSLMPQRDADDFKKYLDYIMGMQVGDIGSVVKGWAGDPGGTMKWYHELYDPQVAELSMPNFAKGGGMKLGGAPHWIVDRFLKPVAAITEDGKDEVVKGKGGVEVIPTDPARKKNYLARKRGEKNEISRNTTMGGARRKHAVHDGRKNNGKTNNGRNRVSASPPNQTPSVGGRDAMSIKPAPGGTPPPMGDVNIPGNEMMNPIMDIGIPRGETMTPITGDPRVSIPEINGGSMGNPTMAVPTPNGLIPYRAMGGAPRPMFPVVPGRAGGGMLDPNAYGGLGGASNDFVKAGKGSHEDFAAIMQGKKPYVQQQVSQRSFKNGVQTGGSQMNRQGNRVTIQPTGPVTPIPGTPKPGFTPEAGIPGMPKMDASGGNRIIGNETAPTARYGFDKNAPIDIAAHGATRGVKGSPGVRVAQPWKHAPRALLQRGKFGNQLLQSYWSATGGAPEDLADRGAAAAPRAAMSGRSFY